MISFYFFPNTVLIILFIFASIATSFQAAHAWIIAFNNLGKRTIEFICEISLTIFCLVLASLPVFALINRQFSVVYVAVSERAVYIVSVATCLCFIILALKTKKVSFLPLLAIAITLPFLSYDKIYIIYYVVAVLVLLIRALKAVLYEQIRKRIEITAFSIKQGVDTLPAGIMFSGEDGHIFLVNTCMLDLMEKFCNREYKNAKNFWKDMLAGRVKNAQVHLLENTIVVRTDTESWSFIRRSFMINNTGYVEFIATDITETDRTLLALEDDKQKLLNQKKEIQDLTESMIALRKEQEYSRIRSQIHDVMGQRLTAIQRLLQSKQPTDSDQIIPLLKNIIENIREEKKESAGELLLELRLYFKRVGIHIILEGNLPDDEEIAYLFLAVLREATTNAARHAEATEILAVISKNTTEYQFRITNNGKQPKNKGVEGGGLGGIRNRVEASGGTLKIDWLPKFAINIVIKNNR